MWCRFKESGHIDKFADYMVKDIEEVFLCLPPQ